MHSTYFSSCTETSKQTLGLSMFDDIRFQNCDSNYEAAISNDLSLKLRGKQLGRHAGWVLAAAVLLGLRLGWPVFVAAAPALGQSSQPRLHGRSLLLADKDMR